MSITACTCLDLFRDQVRARPDATAVVADGRRLSFAELDTRSDQLARRLRASGVGQEMLVALFMHRCPEVVTGILGVWKAGAAYLPVDPAYPASRIRGILGDSRARAVLTMRHLAGQLPAEATPAEVLYADADQGGDLPGYFRCPPVGPGELAYAVYTSGSTGRPKGVMIEHGGLAEYLSWLTGMVAPSGEPASSLLHSSLSFDFSYSSLFLPLITGGVLTIAAPLLSLEKLPEIIQDPALDVVRLTPSHIKMIATVLHGRRGLPGPRIFLVGGEILRAHHVATLRELFPESRVYNHYGPTEAIIGRTAFEVRDGPMFSLVDYSSHDSIPIGLTSIPGETVQPPIQQRKENTRAAKQRPASAGTGQDGQLETLPDVQAEVF